MHSNSDTFVYDVVIAGAGPVGLFLACELGMRAVSVLVLDRADDPRSPLKRLPFGLRGLTIPTIEAFDRRGLLDDIVGPRRDAAPRRHAGHFAGIPIDADRIDATRWAYRLPGPADANMAAEMERIERVLADRATAMGVEIRRGVGVDGFTQTPDRVTVHAGDRRYEAHWLVGCDGGRSTVRKAGGFAFVGTDPAFTGYSVQVEIADPNKLRLGRHQTATGMYFQTQPGHFGLLDFDGGAAHRGVPLTLAHVQDVLRRISQIDVTLTALHVATSWTDRAQQATAYREGRVLLAGDAAHIHAPLGGQGLNLGLGDAMNLGWKLAATIRGEAPSGLLDTYFAERQPIGAAVLDWSRAQVALMRPDPQARALEKVLRDLVATRDGATYFAGRVWNATLRSDLDDGHPLVGRGMPDFALTDDTRLAVLLREGKGLLVDFDGRPPLRALAEHWGGRVTYISGDARDRLGLGAVLVRPDGVVAWACEGEPDLEGAAAAGSRWFYASRPAGRAVAPPGRP